MSDPLLPVLEEAWRWRESDPPRCQALLNEVSGALQSADAADMLVGTAHQVVQAYLAFRDACQAEALSGAIAALRSLHSQTSSWWYSRALNVRSCALLELGEYEQATLSLREQLRVSRENEDTETEGAGLHDLGVMHTRTHPQTAESYLLSARAVFESQGNTVGRAFCAWSLADLREAQGRGPEALELYHDSLRHARHSGHQPMEVLVLSRLGELALRRGEAQAGEDWLRQALEREARQAGKRPLWVSVPPLVRLMLHAGRLSEARDMLLQQQARAQKAGMVVPLVAVHELLAEVYEALDDPRQALHHLREYQRLFRQENSDEQARRVRALEVLHRTELAKQEADSQRQLNDQLKQTLSDLELLHQQVARASMTDELTGVFNRHFLMTQGAAQLRQRTDQYATVAMLDIDHFKAVNDTYGHGRGDQVLRTFAQFLQDHLGNGALLCRFGGEEFVVIFPDMPPEHALQHLEQLRLLLTDMAVPELPASLRVSFTAGVVACTDGDLAGALRRADTLLLRGKREGRRRILGDRSAVPQAES